jgi:hypothetical protein
VSTAPELPTLFVVHTPTAARAMSPPAKPESCGLGK